MTTRGGAPGRRWWRAAIGIVCIVAAGIVAPDLSAAAPLGVTIHATNGEGRSVTPGRPCNDGGQGAYWHYDYGAAIPGGVLSKLAGEMRVHLNLHSDIVRFPNSSGAYPGAPAGPTAFLAGEESHASLMNERGSVKLRLQSGDCRKPTLAFNGSQATGAGTWVVGEGAGAYRQATGSGQLNIVSAEVNPGADNALDLQLAGAIQVLQPALKVEVLGTYWGQLGVDYLSRRPTVVYRITNTGPGDSFGARLTNAQPATNGVAVLGPTTYPLGDLSSGEFFDVHIRWQLGLLQPCNLILLNCQFNTKLTVDLPDALDAAHLANQTVTARAPSLPPPLGAGA